MYQGQKAKILIELSPFGFARPASPTKQRY